MNNQDDEFSSDDERYYQAGLDFLRNKMEEELIKEIQVRNTEKKIHKLFLGTHGFG